MTPAASFETTYATDTSYSEPEYTGSAYAATSTTESSTYGTGSLFDTGAVPRPAVPRADEDVDSFIDRIVDEASSEDRF